MTMKSHPRGSSRHNCAAVENQMSASRPEKNAPQMFWEKKSTVLGSQPRKYIMSKTA